MNITHDDAAAALREVERTTARSFDARVYRSSGIQLVGWGLIWLVGYSLSGWQPKWIGLTWLVLDSIGFVFSFFVVKARGGARSPVAWRWAVTSMAIIGFFLGVFSLLRGAPPASYAALPALVIALLYTLVGGWRFTRFIWIGAALFILTLVGFFYFRPVIDYWLAVVGGGALMLGGAWLMRA
jgi:hypothetical protein